jgi:ABC-type transport system substrate-binding protein
MSRSARPTVAAAAALGLAASLHAALGPRYGGEARVAVPSLPSGFAPAPGQTTGSRVVGALVHERLAHVWAGTPAPSLAEGWTTAADGREWAIRLRPDLVFHDGAPLTAEDAARSLRAFVGSRSPAAARLGAVLDSVDAVGDSVVLRLSEASPLAMHVLAAPEAAIVGRRGAGAGPFVPTTPVAIRGSARFVAFSRHVRGRPFLDGVVVEEDAARVDAVAGWSFGPPSTVLLLAIDPRRPPFDRVDVRRSVAAICDGDDLVRHFIKGGTPSLLVPPSLEPGSPEPSDAPAPALSSAVTLAVSTEVAPNVSQRIVALLSSTGLRVTARPVAPDAVWADGAPLRLATFTPSVAEAVLALDEIAHLVPASDGDAARALRDEAARTDNPHARAVLARRAEAASRASFVLVPIASLPMGFGVPWGLHAVAMDRTGRLRLEDAWLDP